MWWAMHSIPESISNSNSINNPFFSHQVHIIHMLAIKTSSNQKNHTSIDQDYGDFPFIAVFNRNCIYDRSYLILTYDLRFFTISYSYLPIYVLFSVILSKNPKIQRKKRISFIMVSSQLEIWLRIGMQC